MDSSTVLGIALGVLALGLALVGAGYVGVTRVHDWWVWLRGRDYGYPMFRPGRVYLITVRRARPTLILRRRLAWGYVGQTRNGDFMTRVNQHLHGYMSEPPKWWAGTYAGAQCVYSSQKVTTWGLDFREWLFIKVTFPLHNYKMNRTNPRRVVPPPEVIAQLAELKRRKATHAQQRPRSTHRPGGRPARRGRPVGSTGRGGTRSGRPARREAEW